MPQPPAANAEQSAKWNDRAGRSWVDLADMLDRLLEPFVPPLLEEIGPVAGRRILDVGCGAGALALAVAGQGGRCLGVDISAPLIEAARARAHRQSVTGAEFAQADAQTHRFDRGSFDALVSRFGIMFFADPVAAFGNLRSAVRPDGRLACLAWRGAAENPFMTAAERGVADLLPQLPERIEGGPGQFGFADPDRVRSVLAQSGWRDAVVRPLDVECHLPEAELRLYVRRMGPVAELLPTLDDKTRGEVEGQLDSAFLPFLRDGEARFKAACWMVTARG